MYTLWYGGKIYTMEKEEETVEAVLVKDDKIIATGFYEDLANSAEKHCNLHGAVMYPGFVDSHLHIMSQGEKLVRLDLSEATSSQVMLEMIKEAAKVTPPDQWLVGEGWNENNFVDKKIPTIEELNEIRKEPILLTRVCRHSILVNSSAIEASGITIESESPSGGEIGRDNNGELSGLFYEQAMDLITDTLPKEGETYITYLKKVLNLAIDQMLSYGLTGGHTDDMHSFGEFMNPFTAYRDVIGEKEHFKVNLLRRHTVFDKMINKKLPYQASFLEEGAMKLFLDGSLGSSTAALKAPYSDNEKNKGLFVHTDEEVTEMVKLARENDAAVAIHVIGDAAAEQAIRIIEKHPVKPGKRDRLIHCSILREDLIDRIVDLPVVIDVQPAFVTSDFPWIVNKIGKERLNYTYAWKTLLESGIYCAAGTDAPIESIDPLETIYAAIERKNQHSTESYTPEQKISRFKAIQMYTLGSAQAICKEHERGLIKQNYEADFTVFDRDLFEGTSEDLLNANVVKTIVAGKTVFEKNHQ
ncbi:MAG TPA: amidohydrolase [Pseudogracilibacillus sp.]|nr:amidohydrolase [Pseudogracilibacillus sp.]